jgi:hypothetical protein
MLQETFSYYDFLLNIIAIMTKHLKENPDYVTVKMYSPEVKK